MFSDQGESQIIIWLCSGWTQNPYGTTKNEKPHPLHNYWNKEVTSGSVLTYTVKNVCVEIK